MSEGATVLQRTLARGRDLADVVRTMKAMAASSISQYENAVHALNEYDLSMQLALAASFRQALSEPPAHSRRDDGIGVLVFGSDQGLVGQFNEQLAGFVAEQLAALPGQRHIWVVGERVRARLDENGLRADASLPLPGSIQAITALAGRLLIDLENARAQGLVDQVYLFHNRPLAGALYQPTSQRLLPLDAAWQRQLAQRPWPTQSLPEVLFDNLRTRLVLVREYLQVSLFRACAESMASENACRLAAMQRAEKNIETLLENVQRQYHRIRQSAMDEELFDVLVGVESLDVRQVPRK